MMENPHIGHRDRLRERFLAEGLENFEPHNALELLLFYACPRVDTNEMAHRLIDRFGSLAGVLDASPEELVKVKGMGQNAAVLLRLTPQLMRFYALDSHDREPLDSATRMCEYAKACFWGASAEELRVFCLDDRLCVRENVMLTEGAFSSVPLSARRIVETAFRAKSDLIIIAHNHPNGNELPSDQDDIATRQLFRLLRQLGITLLDHIVVGDGKAFSMRDGGYFYNL